jgi:hypothetical protein
LPYKSIEGILTLNTRLFSEKPKSPMKKLPDYGAFLDQDLVQKVEYHHILCKAYQWSRALQLLGLQYFNFENMRIDYLKQ